VGGVGGGVFIIIFGFFAGCSALFFLCWGGLMV